MVLLVHVAFVSGVSTGPGAAGAFTARAEVGVGVFFVISGFLLYRPFALAHLDAGPARRRSAASCSGGCCRILPLYWAALAAHAAARAGVPAARTVSTPLLLPLLGQVYRGQTVYLGVPQAWSLCVEVVFYVGLPGLRGRSSDGGPPDRRAPERVEWAGVGALYAGRPRRARGCSRRPRRCRGGSGTGSCRSGSTCSRSGSASPCSPSGGRGTVRCPPWLRSRGLAAGCWAACRRRLRRAGPRPRPRPRPALRAGHRAGGGRGAALGTVRRCCCVLPAVAGTPAAARVAAGGAARAGLLRHLPVAPARRRDPCCGTARWPTCSARRSALLLVARRAGVLTVAARGAVATGLRRSGPASRVGHRLAAGRRPLATRSAVSRRRRVTKMAVPGNSRPRSGLHWPHSRSCPSGHSGSTTSSTSKPAATSSRTRSPIVRCDST